MFSSLSHLQVEQIVSVDVYPHHLSRAKDYPTITLLVSIICLSVDSSKLINKSCISVPYKSYEAKNNIVNNGMIQGLVPIFAP